MRVNKRVRRDERGAVLILVATFMIVAVIFLAFVVDIGNQRQDRRQLATATDAAALDVANRWADKSLEPLDDFVPIGANRWDCTQDADSYLQANRPVDAGDYSCEAFFVNGQYASVSVFADGRTDYQVAQAVNIDDGPIASTTSVRLRSTVGGGLRPFTVCARDVDVTAWMNSGGATVEDITLGGDKFLPDECGQNNGNWGFVVFETQGNGQKTLAEIIRDGSVDPVASFDNGPNGNPADPYQDEKAVCLDDGDESPQTLYDDQDPVTCVFNDTGAGGWNNNNALEAFDYLVDNDIVFNLPIYGEIQTLGPGQQTGFPIIAFAEVQLIDYNKAQGGDENDLTLRFLKLSSGECCDVNESNAQVEICDVGTPGGQVLPNFAGNCRTFTGASGGGPVVPPAPQPCEVTGVDPPTQNADVVGGLLVNPVTVTVTVADEADCDTITVDAVGGSRLAGSVGGPSANTYPVTFMSGLPFGPGGTTLTVEVFEDGDLKHDTSVITTVDAVPPCAVTSISPQSSTVGTVNTKGVRTTTSPVTLSVTIQSPPLCGVITAEIRRNPSVVSMTGPTTATATTQYVLPQGSVIPNSGLDQVWDVRIYSDGTLISPPSAGSVFIERP